MHGYRIPRRFLTIAILLIVRPALAQPASMPAQSPIPAPALQQMYARELGKQYQPAAADQLIQAHELIERFFADPSTRKVTLASLSSSGVDPNILGRLARLRMNWPSMAPGVYYINERVGPTEAAYFLGIPKGYDRTVAWPLVIKLPTATPFITEPRPSADEVAQIYTAWANDELSHHPDALVILPLLNLDDLYGPTPQGMNRVTAPLEHAANLVNIDPARVYMVGYAMSAYSVWNLALHEPTYFAAINPLAGNASGDWQRIRLMNLRNVLPVVWHDTEDGVTPIASVRSLVAAMRNLKCDVDYEETKGVGHTPDEALQEREYQKMRARVRQLYPKRVTVQSNRAEPAYNRADWVQADQAMRPGKETRLLLRNGGGSITVYGNTFKVDATITKPGRIDVVTDNTESFRLYFNDQMLDFKQALTVFVNGKARFEGFLKPDCAEMLKDQLLLGRGWRYFTAHVDIDFSEAAIRPTSRPAGARAP